MLRARRVIADAGGRRRRSRRSLAIEAEEDAGKLRPPGAHQAEDAEHLAAVQGEAHVLDDARAAEVARSQRSDVAAAARCGAADRAARSAGRPSA